MSLTNLSNRKKIRLSDFRERVDFYDNVKTENELGETTYKFVKIKSLWASVVTQTGRLQKQQAETMLTNVTHKVIVRYESGKDITKNMQVHFNGRRMAITYIDNLHERNYALEIFCEELMD